MSVDDPCSDEFYENFRKIAKNNAQIYEEVFSTLPTNTIRAFADIENYVSKPKMKETDPFNVCFILFIKRVLSFSK